MKDDNQIQAVDNLLHQLLWGLHLKRLDAWTPELESIGALGLHVLKLAGEKEDIILGEIREILAVPHSTLTSIINRLEGRNLLERTVSRRDRRSFGLALTDEGRRVQCDHDRLDRELALTMLSALDTDDERDTFVTLIEKMSRHLARTDI
ncbi:MAG: MarR family transcriptional regulator [Desulfobacterales bacterium]|nr:MarR family transcriptional regulator [Desulfobacterales bacterium]